MSRPLLAALVIGSILGGTALYTQFLDYLRERAATEAKERQTETAHAAEGQYAIDLTLTATAAPDEFQPEEERSSVIVALGGAKGKRLLRRTDEVKAGSVLRVSDVQGILEGENTFWLEVTPALSGEITPLAVRLQVWKIDSAGRELLLGENTFWGTGGEKAAGTLTVRIAGEAKLHEH